MVNHAEVERLIKKGMDYALYSDDCANDRDYYGVGGKIEKLYYLDWDEYWDAYKEINPYWGKAYIRDPGFVDERLIVNEKRHYLIAHKDPRKYCLRTILSRACSSSVLWSQEDPEIVAGIFLAAYKDEPLIFRIMAFCSFAFHVCGKRYYGGKVLYKKNVAKAVYKILDGLTDDIDVYSIVGELKEYGCCPTFIDLCADDYIKYADRIKASIDEMGELGELVVASVSSIDKKGNVIRYDPSLFGFDGKNMLIKSKVQEACGCCSNPMVSVGYWLGGAYSDAVRCHYEDDYGKWICEGLKDFCLYAVEQLEMFEDEAAFIYENALRIARYFDALAMFDRQAALWVLDDLYDKRERKKLNGYGDVEFVSMEINRDLDTLVSLVGDKFNQSDVDSSCREFTDISYGTLVKIVENKFANPTEQCNKRPVIQHFLRFAKEKPDDYLFSGRVINRKDDFGVYIDAISCKNKKVFREWEEYRRFYDFIDFFKPDACYLHPKKADSHGYLGYAWWD